MSDDNFFIFRYTLISSTLHNSITYLQCLGLLFEPLGNIEIQSNRSNFDLTPLISSAISGTLLFISNFIQCFLFIAIKLSKQYLLYVHIRPHFFLKKLPFLDLLLKQCIILRHYILKCLILLCFLLLYFLLTASFYLFPLL
jgi:hypothetical protein